MYRERERRGSLEEWIELTAGTIRLEYTSGNGSMLHKKIVWFSFTSV